MDAWTDLVERVRSSWLCGRPSRVVAAVSGGADSVALLLVLAELSRQEGFSLFAAHVDHGLRPESCGDAAFVEQLCSRLGVPCRVFHVQVPGRSEDAAREARYDALLHGFSDLIPFHLALGHHQRDQAETVLLHLFRGAGASGLAGMAEKSVRATAEGPVTLWRPFLPVSPQLLENALAARGAAFQTDSTNLEDGYLRNYIRRQVLPLIRARIPRAEEAMGRAARIAADEAAYFRQEAERFLSREGVSCQSGPFRWVLCAPLSALHPALKRHVLRLLCPVKLDWEQTDRLMSVLPGETVNLPEGWRAKCSRDKLCFLPPEDAAGLFPSPSPSDLLASPAGKSETGDGIRTQSMPKEIFSQCTLRTWQTGDRIRPLGAKGSKSLQDYFVDKKVPAPWRHFIPLLCIGNQVIWAVGIGPGEEARVNGDREIVMARYTGFLPGDNRESSDHSNAQRRTNP